MEAKEEKDDNGEAVNAKLLEDGDCEVVIKPGKKDDDSKDGAAKKANPPSPLLTANCFSKLSFWWMEPLFRTGYKRDLQVEDLYQTLPWDRSSPLKARVQRHWETEKREKKSPSLSRAMLKSFLGLHTLQGIVIFVMEMLAIIQPLAVGKIISYFLGFGGVTRTMAIIYTVVLVVIVYTYPMPRTQALLSITNVAMRLRTACSALLYEKTLRLSNKAFGATSTGKIVTLMSSDVEKFHMGTMYLHYLWVAPIQATVIIGLMYRDFGWSIFAGLALMIIVVPIQLICGKTQGFLRAKIAQRSDRRVMLMSEIIAGMRVVKMYCWETPLGKLIRDVRKTEMFQTRKMSHLRGQSQAAYFISGKLVGFLLILTYTMTDHAITAEMVFKMVGWVELIRQNLFLFLPMSIQFGSEMYASIIRIQNFLLLEEKEVNETQDLNENASEDNNSGEIRLQNMTATWTSSISKQKERRKSSRAQTNGKPDPSKQKLLDVDTFSLKDINLHIVPGEFHAIVGPVGSGKSTLLMAFLGELSPTEGTCKVNGRVSYAPQEPWLFAGTVKENILFGQAMDESRYKDVIEACALVEDLDNMPDGDLTAVGERGTALSGGQKARINLARAVYREAEVYLLDDPLSAVDTKIGRHLFEKCILGYLSGRTRILVTHQVQFLKRADTVTALKEGAVVAHGDFSKLKAKGGEGVEEPEGLSPLELRAVNWASEGSILSLGDIGIEGEEAEEEDEEKEKAEAPPTPAEEQTSGTVGWSVYLQYFKYGYGIVLIPMLVILACGFQAAFLMSDWWLAYWSAQNLEYYGNSTTFGPDETVEEAPFFKRNLIIYSSIIAAMIVINVIRSSMMYELALCAAQRLHNTMFQKMLRTNIGFFEKNPVGRILNKFSRDIGFIDHMLPFAYHDVSFFLVTTVGTFTIACVVNPWVILISLPIIVMMIFLRYYAIQTTRDIKRVEAICRSPLYSHMSATIRGVHVIRAFKMEEPMEDIVHSIQDRHTMAWSLFLATYRWLGLRVEWSVATYLTLVLFAAMMMPDGAIDGGLLGLSLTQILAVSAVLQYTVRQSAELESMMTSVERILHYTKLPEEGPEHTDVRPAVEWPTRGDLKLDHMTLRYSPDAPPALDEMCVEITDTEKIGIVGRTGAGKSSLFVSLLRLVEPEGAIIIDGLDVTTIGLKDLREKVAVIPQDPVLFSGTMRHNLDPLSDYTDEQLWAALEQVQLKLRIEELPGQLYTEITEAGGNFSVGQRQLVCLARALLRRNRILIIDEATANVDNATDALIQNTIREQFKSCTVLTIAHRLHTVIDCDRLMVMDHGKIVELGTPHELLQDEEGYFSKMVQHTGARQAAELTKMAHDYHVAKEQEGTQEDAQGAESPESDKPNNSE